MTTEPTITIGAEGAVVDDIQQKLFSPLTGVYDEETAARVRGFQMARGINPTGVVDQDTADELDLEPWS